MGTKWGAFPCDLGIADMCNCSDAGFLSGDIYIKGSEI